MNTRVQAYNTSPTGINSVDVYEDISTRSLNTVRIGQSAGKINSGSFNVYAGYESGAAAVNSSYTTAIGYRAMNASTNSLYSTAIGAFAAAQNTSGSENVYVGYRCGELANAGNQSTAVGAYSMHQNVAANGSVAIGYRSAERTLDGGFCVFIGAQAGQDNRNSLYSTMAGYQSGRASRGDENCLFGAYSGYSNINGNGSCLFGYKSGQYTSGDFNCSFGAYSMQYASGSCNVAIGAFANSSGYNSAESVFVGTNVASTGSASQSVILGTNAGATASGSGLVILGYNAGTGFEFGNCNILIGQGASTFKSYNDNGISIGSINSLTYTNSISIGNTVINQNQNSILVGFNLNCDANQSIILGNNNIIQSVELFQDPLSYLYINSVLQDGKNKIGLSSINYCNILISPLPTNTIYTIAQASIYTSNIINSEKNPPSNGIVSSTYNLLTDIPQITNNGYAIVTGQCFPIKNSVDTTSNVNLYTSPILSNITPTFNGVSSIYLNDYLFVDKLTNTFTFPNQATSVTANIRIYNASTINTDIYIPKTVSSPILNYGNNYSSNINIYNSPLKVISENTLITLKNSQISISYDSQYGLILPINNPNTTQNSFIINKQPLYGDLHYNITNTNNFTYKPFIESAFAKNDTIEFVNVLNITSNTGLGLNCAYGIISSNISIFNIKYNVQSNEIYTANSILYPTLNNSIVLNNQLIQTTTTYTNVSNSSSNIVISHIGSNQSIYYKPTNQTFSYENISAMSNANIWNYTDINYIPYLQNLLTSINTCIISNTNSNNTILYPYINDMSLQLPSMSNQINYNDTQETNYFNILNNNFIAFSNIQIPYTLFSLSNSLLNLLQYDENLIQYNSFNNFNNDLIYYTNIFIGNKFYYMNSNIINTSNIVNVTIRNNDVYNNSLTNLYTYTINASNSYTYYQNALDISSDIYTIYNNYLVVPRLLLSYADFNKNNIILLNTNTDTNTDTNITNNDYLELVISDYTNIAYSNLNNIPIAKHINYIYGSNSSWNISTSGFTSNINFSNNILSPISLNLPSQSLTNLIVEQLITHGIINNINNNYVYLPRNLWAVTDNLGIIITSNTDVNNVSSFANYTFNYSNNLRIQSPLYVQTPVSYSNITDTFNTINNVITNSKHASNIDTIVTYSIDGIINSNLMKTTYTPISYYTDATGIYKNNSNIIITNNIYKEKLDVFSKSGEFILTSNLYYVWTNDNINYNVSYTSNTNIYSWSNTNPLNYNVASNQIVYYTNTNCNIVYTENIHLYNITNTYVNEYVYNNSFYDIINSTNIYNIASSNFNPNSNILYSVTSNIPYNGLIINTTSNIIINTNVSYYESFVKLNTNNIWTNNSQYNFNIINYNVHNSPVIHLNTGPITHFIMDDINNGLIYIHSSNYNIFTGLNNYNICFNSNSISNILTINPINTPISSIPITHLHDTTLIIDSATSLASLSTLINSAITQIALPVFTPTNVYLYSFNNKHGSLVINNTTTSELKLVTNISLTDLPNLNYLASSKYETDTFAFFFSDNTHTPVVTSQLFIVNLLLNHTPITYRQSSTLQCGQAWNSGLSFNNTYTLSSNALYYSFNGINSSNILYNIVNKPYWININNNNNTFTQHQINTNSVAINITSIPNHNTIINDVITYNIIDVSTGNPLGSSLSFPIASYYFNSYPNPKSTLLSSLNMFGIDNSLYNIQLVGEFWNIITNLKVQNIAVDPYTVTIIIKSLKNGFLWNKTLQSYIQTVFTLDDLLSNKLVYIPFNPNITELNTDTLVLNIGYSDGSLSPTYTINLNPYISRFYKGSTINTGVYSQSSRTIQQPIYSKACITNNVTWSLINSNIVDLSCLYNSNINAKWLLNEPEYSVYNGTIYTQSINTLSYSTPISITNSNIVLILDQCDSIILNSLLNNISFNSNLIYDCYLYILSNPIYGIIQNKQTGSNVVRFSINDLYANNIIYQNFGSLNINDTFTVGVSSTPYNLNLEKIIVNLQINPLPVITKNNTTFLYFNNSNSALTSNIIISNNDINIINNSVYNVSANTNKISKIHIINSSNIDLNSNIFINNVDFYINSNIVRHGAPYDTMSFNYIVNNVTSINPLALISPYKNLFINNHNILLNTHIDSNVILPGQERIQSITYSINSNLNTLINENNHTLTLSVQVQPFSSLTNNELNFLHNYNFNINVTDINNNSLLFADFHRTHINIYDINKNSNIVLLDQSQQLLETTWNVINIINLDPLNDYGVSLIWYDGTNLLSGSTLKPIVNKNIANISISIDTLGSENYIASSNFIISSLNSNITNSITNTDGTNDTDGTMGASYNLNNYYTTHQLRDFQILVSTYNANAVNILDTNVNNVVLGNRLTVRGVNNICIGDTFATSGTNSIIVGNQIGSITSGDIYQSIVIGNSCFQNSTLRDIICIGRNNLNNLSINQDPIKIQNFIAQSPIILGNNIGSAMIDFNINIDNTFLKSTVITNGITESQIYIGYSSEPVGIGYTCNVHITQDYALNVNGSILAKNINAPLSMNANSIDLNYNIIPSGYLVSSTGNTDINGNLLIKMAGINGIYDSNVIGIANGSNSLGQTLISVSGNGFVWCDTAVTCGQYLVCSPNNIGVASADETNIKTNYVFGKSLVNCDPANTALYPNILTKTVNNIIFGKINCLINI